MQVLAIAATAVQPGDTANPATRYEDRVATVETATMWCGHLRRPYVLARNIDGVLVGRWPATSTVTVVR